MTSEGCKKQIEDNALSYLKAVKDVFHDKNEIYSSFLELMKDYRDKRIDVEDAIAKVKELFKEHKDLLLGFNNFLPSSHQITVSLEDEQPLNEQPPQYEIKVPSEDIQPPQKMLNESQVVPLGNELLPPTGRNGTYEEATKFVSKVKARFQGDGCVFKSFLDNINMLGEGKRSMSETYQEVASLLEGHIDLLDELNQFFPVLQEQP